MVAEEKTVRIFGLAAVKLLLANPLRFWLAKIPNFDCRWIQIPILTKKETNPQHCTVKHSSVRIKKSLIILYY